MKKDLITKPLDQYVKEVFDEGLNSLKVNGVGLWNEDTATAALDDAVIGSSLVKLHEDKFCGAYVPEHIFVKWK